MLVRQWIVVSLMLWCVVSMSGGAEAVVWTAERKPEPVPAGASDVIKATLSDSAVVISADGQAVYTYWPLRSIPLKGAPASAGASLEQVVETTLLGCVRVHAERKDYRGDRLPAGDYTMRLGLRPEDRSHRDVSDHRYFGILLPVARDKKLDSFKDHDSLAEASAEESDEFHPFIISLWPDSDPARPALSVGEPATEHKSIRLEQSGRAGDADITLSFEFVVAGQGRR